MSKTSLGNLKKLTPTRVVDLIKSDYLSFQEYQESLVFQKKGFNLTKMDLSHSTLINLTFRNANFNSSLFSFCKVTGVTFVGCDLSCANLRGAVLSSCSFIDCNLNLAKFEKTVIDRMFVLDSDFRAADFNKSSISSSLFHGCNLSNSKLDCSNIKESLFINSNLNNISIMGSQGVEDNLFFNCEELPKSVSSKINTEVHGLKTADKNFKITKEDAIRIINQKKFEQWELGDDFNF